MRAGMASGEARRGVGDDTPSLVAALMAQRPPYTRPREDALLQAERLYYWRLIAGLCGKLRVETAAVRSGSARR